MKFKYKVLAINLIMLTLAISITGFFMMSNSFKLSIESEIRHAVTENNLSQAVVEYELLKEVNSSIIDDYDIAGTLEDIGRRVASGMSTGDSGLFIRYADDMVFSGSENTENVPEDLFVGFDKMSKSYSITHEKDSYYIYVASHNKIYNKELSIIIKRNVTAVYRELNDNLRFYVLLFASVLAIAAVLLYIISSVLTNPLEKLNKVTEKIAGGEYDVRSDVGSSDEVGMLSDKFNVMAESVENHVNELQDMVVRRDRFVKDFIHEIKTPMTSVIGYADTLRSIEMTEEEEKEALDYIYSEGKRLENLSMRLFDLLYLKDNDITKVNSEMDVIIREACQSMKPKAESREIKINAEAEKGCISCDRELIKTVVINIIDNAIKASDKGSQIDVTGKCDDGKYILKIKDSGIGMTEEDIKYMFDEFYMADKSRTRREGGAGIGLSLVKQILDRHDAEISVESEMGKGTTVSICFKTIEE